MDLNYLFFRQQVERSRASSATSDVARKAHEELAARYEKKIGEVRLSDEPEARSSGDGASPDDPPVNPTMAVALTARSCQR